MKNLELKSARAAKDLSQGELAALVGVTQAADQSKKNRMLTVMLAGFVFLMVFYAVRKNQGAETGGMEEVFSVVSFAISFVGVWYLYQRHEKKRQKKLDSRYDEE